jgi:dimethylaniline monooxygenase (N-oxide forming)
MIQHDDFWDLISKNVHVHRGDVIDTTANSLVLDDSTEVQTDVVLCGTGWNAEYSFFSPEQATKLGLPHDPCYEDAEELQRWNNLMDAADRQILKQFPILAKPPPHCKPVGNANLTPARLYNGIASLTDSSIIFLGRARMSNNFRGAEAQAIWATAYWDGNVTLPLLKQARLEVAYMNAFSRRRYPSRGIDGVNFHADLVWYTDKLIYEAGLTSHRKGWWKDWDEPCLASDLKDCKDEYLANRGSENLKIKHPWDV